MQHILSTALADGGPVCQGIVALGVLLGVLHGATSGMAVRRPRRVWVALWPFVVVAIAGWVATLQVQADVSGALQDYTRATWPMRLQSGLHSLAGIAVATALATLTTAGLGGLVASGAALLRGGRHTAWHAMVPVALLGGLAAAVPEHVPVVVGASLAALWGLLVTSRQTDAMTRALAMLNGALVVSAGCGLALTLHVVATMHGLPHPDHARLVCAVAVPLAVVALGVPWVAMRPGRGAVGSLMATVMAVGIVGGAVYQPMQAVWHLEPELEHLAQRDRLGVLTQHGIEPAPVTIGEALSERPVIAVTRDLLLVQDSVIAYRNEASGPELRGALSTHREPLAIDAHEVWSDVAPILAAVDSPSVDVVVQCTHAVLCTVSVELSEAGMAVPNDMRWAEVVERAGGQAGLVLRPSREP